MGETIVTLEDLLAKTPMEFRPVVAQYGPALAAMTAAEFAAWLELLIAGKTWPAWQAVMDKLSDQPAILAAWDSVKDKWAEANEANARARTLAQDAAMAVLKVLLTVALAAVGL
ncbi:MAG TPA: hypothetical protein VM238_10520 [Phycisphaerae bacterium]|nr:hypothetical protein [Phycisphaerae bacterium]